MTQESPIRLSKDGFREAVLTKTATGWATPDGRFTVEPATMGGGVTGWASGHGWSNGHKAWFVVDTSGRAQFRPGSITVAKARKVVDRLYEARRIIAGVLDAESAK